MSPDDSGTGRGFKISVLITVKTVVFAPIPKARIKTTGRTNSGLFKRLLLCRFFATVLVLAFF
jgi:hypothetical protein